MFDLRDWFKSLGNGDSCDLRQLLSSFDFPRRTADNAPIAESMDLAVEAARIEEEFNSRIKELFEGLVPEDRARTKSGVTLSEWQPILLFTQKLCAESLAQAFINECLHEFFANSITWRQDDPISIHRTNHVTICCGYSRSLNSAEGQGREWVLFMELKNNDGKWMTRVSGEDFFVPESLPSYLILRSTQNVATGIAGATEYEFSGCTPYPRRVLGHALMSIKLGAKPSSWTQV